MTTDGKAAEVIRQQGFCGYIIKPGVVCILDPHDHWGYSQTDPDTPTTPTGKRHYDRVQRVGYAWFKGDDILDIEREMRDIVLSDEWYAEELAKAAAAERKRLKQTIRVSDGLDGGTAIWLKDVFLADPEDDDD